MQTLKAKGLVFFLKESYLMQTRKKNSLTQGLLNILECNAKDSHPLLKIVSSNKESSLESNVVLHIWLSFTYSCVFHLRGTCPFS